MVDCRVSEQLMCGKDARYEARHDPAHAPQTQACFCLPALVLSHFACLLHGPE